MTRAPLAAVTAGAVFTVEAAATFVAVTANLPAQFGSIGRYAAEEWISRWTAISPRPAPMIAMLVALAARELAHRRRNRWRAPAAD